MRDTLAGAEVLSFVILLFAILGPQPANAVVMSTDVKFTPTNGANIANRYQLNLVSPNPIPIDATSRFGGDVVFMGGSITGAGTTRASLDFYGGATLVHPGQTIHIGFASIGNSNVKVAESFWALDAPEVLPIGMASATFNGAASDFLVARVSLFDDAAGSHQIGTMWWEDQASSVALNNFTTEPVYASVAFAHFSNMIPLEDLNASLTGFGPESGIQFLAPIPEPETYVMFMAGLGLMSFMARYRRRKGQG
jgi:hypothetical protein